MKPISSGSTRYDSQLTYRKLSLKAVEPVSIAAFSLVLIVIANRCHPSDPGLVEMVSAARFVANLVLFIAFGFAGEIWRDLRKLRKARNDALDIMSGETT